MRGLLVNPQRAPSQQTGGPTSAELERGLDVAIGPGEHIQFVVINTGGFLSVGLLALLGVAPLKLAIERTP